MYAVWKQRFWYFVLTLAVVNQSNSYILKWKKWKLGLVLSGNSNTYVGNSTFDVELLLTNERDFDVNVEQSYLTLVRDSLKQSFTL